MTKIKKIKGFKGYFVTDSGKVLSERHGEFKWLKPRNQGRIALCTNGKVKQMYVHRLVAQAFVPVPNKYADMKIEELEVHHADFNHSNNLASNLMWLTNAEHKNLHSESEVTFARKSAANKGENNPFYGKYHSEESRRKMSEAHKGKPNLALSKAVMQFTKDGVFVAEYLSTMEAERQTKVNNSSISMCCIGKRKSAGGFMWKYAA